MSETDNKNPHHVHWSADGMSGRSGRYDIQVIPYRGSFRVHIGIGKSLITKTESIETQAEAQAWAEDNIASMSKSLSRLLDRINYSGGAAHDED